MAIDNSLYDALENTYFKIQEYLQKTQLGPEHSAVIVKHEELSTLLETLDIEALEEQSSDIHGLHAELDLIKEFSTQIIDAFDDLSDSNALSAKIVHALDEIFLRLTLVMK